MRNLTVLARNDGDGFFYRGSVASAVLNREDKLVEFYNLPAKNVSYKHIILMGGAIPWKSLGVFDCVLTSLWPNKNCNVFVPGLVVGLPNHCHYGPQMYTILMYNNQHAVRERKDILWIGSERYKEILDYLWTLSNTKIRRSCSDRILSRRRPQSPRRIKRPNTGRERTSRPRPKQEVFRPRNHSNKISITSSVKSYGRVPVHRTPSSSSSPSAPIYTSTGEKNTIASADIHPPTPSPDIALGSEVLARFSDDGWFYFGVVSQRPDAMTYTILDSTGHTERIAANDVIDADSCHTGTKQPGDHVLGLHPHYLFSYAPAEIISVNRIDQAFVRFFDGARRNLPSNEMYKISAGTYRRVTNGIESCLIGRGDKVLVLRDDSTGFYKKIGVTVIGPSKNNDGLIIQDDINVRQVSFINVFQSGRTENNRVREDWMYVLAPADDTTYIPAKIVSLSPLKIQTCLDSNTRIVTSLADCFYLSEMYHDNAVNYINHMNNIQRPELSV